MVTANEEGAQLCGGPLDGTTLFVPKDTPWLQAGRSLDPTCAMPVWEVAPVHAERITYTRTHRRGYSTAEGSYAFYTFKGIEE